MKYLVLLLSLFMVSSVNADEKKVTVDLSSYIPQCTYELFSKKMTKKQKSEICFIAYMYKADEFKKKSDYQTLLAVNDLLVKSCNYYSSKSNKHQNEACNEVKRIYNEYCINCGVDYENCLYVPDLCMILERLK